MANCCKITVRGWAPFDLPQRVMSLDNEAAKSFLAWLSGPSFGFKLEWGEHVMVPNEHGGETATYRFTVSGVEAMWFTGLVKVFRGWVAAGARIEHAVFDDMDAGTSEYDALGDIVRDA